MCVDMIRLEYVNVVNNSTLYRLSYFMYGTVLSTQLITIVGDLQYFTIWKLIYAVFFYGYWMYTLVGARIRRIGSYKTILRMVYIG
jgi:hypothetical protein